MLDAIDRRRFLLQSAMTGTAFFLPRRHAWSAAPSEPVVDTTSGKIRGMAVDGIAAFKGIPYGASTAGASRFDDIAALSQIGAGGAWRIGRPIRKGAAVKPYHDRPLAGVEPGGPLWQQSI